MTRVTHDRTTAENICQFRGLCHLSGHPGETAFISDQFYHAPEVVSLHGAALRQVKHAHAPSGKGGPPVDKQLQTSSSRVELLRAEAADAVELGELGPVGPGTVVGPSEEPLPAYASLSFRTPLFSTTSTCVVAVNLAVSLALWGFFWAIFSKRLFIASVWGSGEAARHSPLRVGDVMFAVFAAFETLDSVWYLLLLRANKPSSSCTLPETTRVAFVVTKVPSEPLEMIVTTLSAMLAQDLGTCGIKEYDVWLADEDPSEETLAWCADNGVRVSTRKGVKAYHQPEWPRRTRCKEGNLAYFYDTEGYEQYDIVCQFDADHVPSPSYLAAVLPAYADPCGGYVACPSICDANADVSWAVRGRLWLEAYMHGPWGAARSCGAFPCCIGSHYSVRTAALHQIGGVGPELDEDFSTSLNMTACGWKGVFAMDAIAHGDGPATFEDAMRQEYQWSRSAILILLKYLGPQWRLPFMSLQERFSVVMFFLFWVKRSLYPFASLIIVTLASCGVTGASFRWQAMLVLVLIPTVPQLLNFCFFRYLGVLRPANARPISYEAILHSLCQPLWIAYGCLHGTLGALAGLHFDIKVTPKGPGGMRLLSPTLVLPLLSLSTWFGLLSLRSSAMEQPGFGQLVLFLSTLYWAGAASVTLLHVAENYAWRGLGWRGLPWRNLSALSLLLFVSAWPFIIVALRLVGKPWYPGRLFLHAAAE